MTFPLAKRVEADPVGGGRIRSIEEEEAIGRA